METQVGKFDFAALKPSNKTEETIILNLHDRKRFRRETNLGSYQAKLLRKGEKIVDEEYMATWKKWETLGLGSIIFGRKGNPSRFKWNYNLKWVANAAMSGEEAGAPEVLPGQPKRGRGRPAGSKNKRRPVIATRRSAAPVVAPTRNVKDLSVVVLQQVLKLASDAQELIKTINQVEQRA